MNKRYPPKEIFAFSFIVILILVTVFAFTPLALIMARGVGSIYPCLKSPEVLSSLKLSFITSFSATMICLLFSLPVAYSLARFKVPLKKTVSMIVYLPMSLPHVVSGIALLIFFGNTQFGHALTQLGWDFIFTVKGIIIAQVFVSIPYMIRMLRTSIEGVDSRIEFIARTLGANSRQVFFYVTLPLIKNGLIAAIVMTWCKAIGEFGAVLMLAGATQFKTAVLPTSIFLNISTGELDLAVGTASILIFISLVTIFFFEMIGKEH